ncbi:histidinol-phosphate phosphatase [Candidatus Methylomirabilis lanthanidiphila]|uniref:Inositol-1-monophosphatase n=1 Tax=Candidatus Methylomirabilis lanthanidiphila TaxID=2211376 RepID=A0A564ZP20_9BACT|nr:inositol monophosphatase [Candidatus Methylomirabilis lanthanidiphila]VUZ86402.1 histidinol-phosphate phosphatase [Candidatus Methylomirabilis lanthanidiphila]
MEIDVIREVALRAAKEAGAILRQGLEQQRIIEFKGVKNLVTDMDRRSEETIADLVRQTLPHHSVVCEEGTRLEGDSGYRWYVDPLDGTTNYAHGYPCYSVSIGVEKDGDLIFGCVYDPSQEELFIAERGGGAFLNGKRLRVSAIANLPDALLATGFPNDVAGTKDNNLDYFVRFMKRAQGVRRPGSAALDLCYVAAGRFDSFWELKLYPWDMAAGVLIVTEAGGRVTDLRGGPHHLSNPQIVASNGLLHDEMLHILAMES